MLPTEMGQTYISIFPRFGTNIANRNWIQSQSGCIDRNHPVASSSFGKVCVVYIIRPSEWARVAQVDCMGSVCSGVSGDEHLLIHPRAFPISLLFIPGGQPAIGPG